MGGGPVRCHEEERRLQVSSIRTRLKVCDLTEESVKTEERVFRLETQDR